MASNDNVSRATYPLPEPLVRRLQAKNDVVVEDPQSALNGLCANAVQAMDGMFFATPPKLRSHPAFAHRLCLRVKGDGGNKLSITDLGMGMTRADLINSLGIGRSTAAASAEPAAATRKKTAAAEEEEEDDYEYESDDGGVPSDDNDELMTDDDDDDNGASEKEISCLARDIGGFYAAICALAKSVKVGTKSRHDDYYEFELLDASNATAFTISRPNPEGTPCTLDTGFDAFGDVRGDSGTCVILTLNDKAIAAGLADETKLRNMFQETIETTQYSVVFSTDEAAAEIIAASTKEGQVAKALEQEDQQDDDDDPLAGSVADMDLGGTKMVTSTVKERAKYIPLRLSLGERKMLRLVEACMNTTDYTTLVDVPSAIGSPKALARRTHEQLRGVTSVLRGLVTACDYPSGQRLLLEDAANFADFMTFFRQMFEIARRHKICNPEKMRTEYGKLIYILQDAVSPTVKPHLGFSLKSPLSTVYKFLQERQGLALLEDKFIEDATEEILALKLTRAQIDTKIRHKERAVAHLKKKYRSQYLSSDDIHLVLYSICDNNSFLNSNRVPIDKIIDYLTSHFDPKKIEPGYSLAITSGQDGARLSHDHARQYTFCLQSLTLWRDIVNDMFRLWSMAEEDLLSESITYSLQDTGQGLQRVQQSPRTYQAMTHILQHRGKQKWIGSSVIHMGDHNVPNALSFIDKYTQVPRILGPIVACLENLHRICEQDDGVKTMVEACFGGPDKLQKDILYDFFKFAFDGSGADNFYDAGSCIDGRLTSAWNWCSNLPNKPFYAIFKLTGFIGFDGEFK